MKPIQTVPFFILFCLLPTIAISKSPIMSMPPALAACTDPPTFYDRYPWSLMLYYGRTVDASLLEILQFHPPAKSEYIQSVELAHTLPVTDALRQLLRPLVSVTQIAGNLTLRHNHHQSTIYEFDPYLIFRWSLFPWQAYLNTSLGFGEGVSYTTGIPNSERRKHVQFKRKHFLNYLLFEATFAAPHDPRWQLVVRIHHRSGAFGLYAKKDVSNAFGIGIRYLFD
jgi:hypothetical protein